MAQNSLAQAPQQDLGNSLLNSLIQLSQNANPVGNMTNMAANTGMQLGQKAADPVSQIMGDVAKKSLVKYFTGHADNLLATDPNGAQILAAHVPQANGPAMGGGQLNPNSGASASFAPQAAPGQTQSPIAQPPQQAMAPQAQPSQGTNPLQVLTSLLGQVRQLTTTPEHRLLNAQAQLTSQQAQNQTPEGAVALEKAKAEGVPPTQFEKSQLAGLGYTAQVQAVNDELTRIQSDKQNVVEQLKAALDLRNPIQKGLGTPGVQVKALQSQLMSLNKAEAQVHQKMVGLFNKQPNTKQSGQEQSGPFQVGQSLNGETIRNVKKIG